MSLDFYFIQKKICFEQNTNTLILEMFSSSFSQNKTRFRAKHVFCIQKRKQFYKRKKCIPLIESEQLRICQCHHLIDRACLVDEKDRFLKKNWKKRRQFV